MNAETEQTTMTDNVITLFGAKLQAAREASGLERKDIAAQLRLNERFIVMMEQGQFGTDVPLMFIRGYLRAYSKLLHLPEETGTQALEALKPQPPVLQQAAINMPTQPVTSGNYFMQIFTTLVVITLVSLVGTWWYTHTSANNETQALDVSAANNQAINLPLVSNEATRLALPSNAKLADATPPTDSSIANPSANGGVDKKGLDANGDIDKKSLNANSGVDKKGMNANGDVDKKSLDANGAVDKKSLDDNDPDETESND